LVSAIQSQTDTHGNQNFQTQTTSLSGKQSLSSIHIIFREWSHR